MKNANIIIRIIIIALGLVATACTNPSVIESSFEAYKMPIEYLRDSKKVTLPNRQTICFNSIINRGFIPVTMVKEFSRSTIVLGEKKKDTIVYLATLGQNSLRTTYSEFLLNSLSEETERSAKFLFDRRMPNKDEYSLDFFIDTCETNAKYITKMTASIIYYLSKMKIAEVSQPASTFLKIKVTLKKNKEAVFTKDYIVKRTNTLFNTGIQSVDKLEEDFVANMVESLSYASKEFVETLIEDLNKRF